MKRLDTLTPKVEFNEKLTALKNQFQTDMMQFYRVTDFQAFLKSYNLEIQRIDKRLKDFDHEFKLRDQHLDDLRGLIALRTLQTDFQDHLEYCKQYALYDQLLGLERKVFPMLDAFGLEMRAFKREREQHMQILLRYDQILLEKASKISLDQVK